MRKILCFFICCSFTGILHAQQETYQQYMNLSYAEIDSLVMIPYQKGNFRECLPIMQAGKEKAKIEFGEQDSVFAEYLYNVGFFYGKLNQYNKTLTFYIRVKNIQEKVLGNNHPAVANTLNGIALMHQQLGDYSKALPHYIRAKNILENTLGEKNPTYAGVVENLAGFYLKMGQYDESLQLFMQAVNIKGSIYGKDHPQFAQALNNLAILYQELGNIEKALPLYIQSNSIKEKVYGENHPILATGLHNLADLYTKMKNYEEAIRLQKKSLSIEKKITVKGYVSYAKGLNTLGKIYLEMGDYEQALSILLQAKEEYEKQQTQQHPSYSYTLSNLASAYKSRREYDKALAFNLQAKNAAAASLGKQHPFYATIIVNAAHVYIDMGQYEEAWKALEEVVNSSSPSTCPRSFEEDWVSCLKNAAYPSNHHLDNVINALSQMHSILQKDSSQVEVTSKQKTIANLVLGLLKTKRNEISTEKDKLRVLQQSNSWLQKSLNVLNLEKDVPEAIHLADQNKLVLLLQATRSEAAYRLGDLPDSLAWQNKKLLKKQSQLQAQLMERRSKAEKDSLRTELIAVNQKLDGFVALIKKEYPKYHKLKYQQVDTKVGEIQALLDPKTALLEYVISDSVLHIFCVDKDEVIWKQETVADSVLKDQIKTLHSSLSDYKQISEEQEQNFKTYTNLAHWFYQKTVAPALEGKDQIKNLIIVTDRELGHLPFEAFLVEEAAGNASYKDLHYLVQDYNISYNYSAGLWQENKTARKPENNGEMLAMAAHYTEEIDSNLVRGRLPTARWMRDALSPLPAAREEVEALAAQFKGYFAFDSLASERTLREKAAEYAIIHLAMHGLLDEKRPILSSLALTEDGDSTYDNFWKAHEISKMELNADLVVLSACETGYGRFETGNGIASLARSFMYAGVPSLVVSLWQVNDASTSQIMQAFYANLAKGLNKAEALRQAKLNYIEQVENPLAAHPAFWSPFILIGDESPVKLQQKGLGNWVWWAGGGAGLLGLLGLVGLSRRKRAT